LIIDLVTLLMLFRTPLYMTVCWKASRTRRS